MRIGFSRMLSRSHGCSGSGWPLWTTFSGSKVPFLMAWMRRALFFLRRYLPKVWACSLPRKVRLSCFENIVAEDSSRRWDFNAKAAAPTASTPVAAHDVHSVPRDDARGIWGSPWCINGVCDREFGRASTVRKDLWRPHTATAASKRPQRRDSRCILPAAIMIQAIRAALNGQASLIIITNEQLPFSNAGFGIDAYAGCVRLKASCSARENQTLQGLASRHSKMQSTLIATSHAMNGHTDHTKTHSVYMYSHAFISLRQVQVTLSLDNRGMHTFLPSLTSVWKSLAAIMINAMNRQCILGAKPESPIKLLSMHIGFQGCSDCPPPKKKT